MQPSPERTPGKKQTLASAEDVMAINENTNKSFNILVISFCLKIFTTLQCTVFRLNRQEFLSVRRRFDNNFSRAFL